MCKVLNLMEEIFNSHLTQVSPICRIKYRNYLNENKIFNEHSVIKPDMGYSIGNVYFL